jgi:hypothetical protein
VNFCGLAAISAEGNARSLHAPWIGIRQSKSLVGMTTEKMDAATGEFGAGG